VHLEVEADSIDGMVEWRPPRPGKSHRFPRWWAVAHALSTPHSAMTGAAVRRKPKRARPSRSSASHQTPFSSTPLTRAEARRHHNWAIGRRAQRRRDARGSLRDRAPRIEPAGRSTNEYRAELAYSTYSYGSTCRPTIRTSPWGKERLWLWSVLGLSVSRAPRRSTESSRPLRRPARRRERRQALNPWPPAICRSGCDDETARGSEPKRAASAAVGQDESASMSWLAWPLRSTRRYVLGGREGDTVPADALTRLIDAAAAPEWLRVPHSLITRRYAATRCVSFLHS